MAALEVGSEVWIPCDKEVWRAGVVLSFETETVANPPAKGSPLKVKPSVVDWVVVEVQVAKGAGKGLVRNRQPILTREEVRVPQPVPGQKVPVGQNG